MNIWETREKEIRKQDNNNLKEEKEQIVGREKEREREGEREGERERERERKDKDRDSGSDGTGYLYGTSSHTRSLSLSHTHTFSSLILFILYSLQFGSEKISTKKNKRRIK